MNTKNPTFQLWNTIIAMEKQVLIINQADHGKDYHSVEALEYMVSFFFALDLYIYAC